MKNESEPITTDEFVLRLIWRDYFKQERLGIVTPSAFRPRKDETDGISVFRSACVENPADVLAVMIPEKRGKYAVAQVSVSQLLNLELSVSPAKIDSVPGHAVVPELNISAVKIDKRHWEMVQEPLALKAVVLIPPLELNI